jgi:hypothetical protein
MPQLGWADAPGRGWRKRHMDTSEFIQSGGRSRGGPAGIAVGRSRRIAMGGGLQPPSVHGA